MNNKLLSIYIPTLNRCDMFNNCISSIVEQAKELKVPIYISDNNSDDNTENVALLFANNYENIFYYKQKSRLDLDAHQNYYLKIVDSKYCLMIADDDALEPNALNHIVNILKDYQPDFLLLNGYHYENDMIKKKYLNIDINKDIPINNPIYLLEHYIFKMHFSMLIVDVDMAKQIDFNKYIGTYHAYVGILFEYLSKVYEKNNSIKGLVVSSQMILIRDGEKTYSEKKIEVLFDMFPSLFEKLPLIYGESAKKKLYELIKQQTYLKTLILFRINNFLDFDKINNYKKYINKYILIKIYLICIIPKYILGLSYKLHLFLRKLLNAKR